ncbi:dicarboxylate/amino acid:cation symporter [Thomasclavelia sp.]
MNANIMNVGALLITLLFFGLIYFLKERKKMDFGVLTILAAFLGILVGICFKKNYVYIEIIGIVYSNLIISIVIPLLLFSIISSITNLNSSLKLKKIGFKTIFYLLLNTFLASLVTLFFSIVTKIGSGINYELSTNYKAVEVPTISEIITSLFPKNIIESWLNGEVVPILVFAIIIAISYNKLANKEKKVVEPFKKFIDAGNYVFGEVVNFVIGFTPYAILVLIARAVGKSTLSDLLPLLGVLALAYFLSIIQIFVVESLLLKIIGKINPINFFKGIWPAGIIAFTSQSSIGTIPVTVRQLVKKIGVNEEIASFVAGLGANLGMPGCAGIWPTLLAVFAVNLLGLDYSITQYAFLVVLSVVVSIGTVGVPGTATITATAVFAAAGLPIEIIVLLTPISTIVDMARTATNVVGAATVATIVAKTEDELNLSIYNINS